MIHSTRRFLQVKLLFFAVCLVVGILIASCSSHQEPPYIGVFLKNPGEDFLKLDQGGPGDFASSTSGALALSENWTRLFERLTPFPDNYVPFPNDYQHYPVATKGARIYFYGVQIDYTNFFLVLPAYPKGFEKTQVPVKKLDEDLYYVDMNDQWLGDGTIVLASKQYDRTDRWFLRGEGPRLVTKNVTPDSGREQYFIVAREDTTFKSLADRWRFIQCGKYTRWYASGQIEFSGSLDLPHKTLAQAIADLCLDTLFATPPDDITKSRIRNLVRDNVQWWREVTGEIETLDSAAVMAWLTETPHLWEFQSQESRRTDIGLTSDQFEALANEVKFSAINSTAHGPWTYWHLNGKKWMEGNFALGNKTGAWKWWDSNGNATGDTVFDNGRVVETK